jgi:Vitamin K-dependent gamma-carboxylase
VLEAQRTDTEVATVTRSWSTAVAAGAAALLVVGLSWLTFRRPLADAIDRGITVPWFGVPVRTFNAEPLALVDRAALLVALFATVLAVLSTRQPRFLRRFIFAAGSPVDLAVLRIVIFGVLAILPRVREAVDFAGLPATLRTPPAGMPWILDLVPTTPVIVGALASAFVAACLLACVGLWTRPAAITAVVLGLYILAIPQFYGKVTHYHHLWWIAAVLAVSHCGHAVSIDAIRRSWRRGDGQPGVPRPAVAYGLPIRVVWLLIALTYFFPGAWKWISAGPDWAFSDNVRTIMYEHWSRLEGFTPLLPVDQWPWAYQLGGLGVIVFEIAFVLLILNRHTRAVAVVAGLVFHTTNYLLLRLGFFTLQICYVAFVPWERFLRRVGTRQQSLQVVNAAGRSARLVGSVRSLDVFGNVDVVGNEGWLTVRTGDQVATGWDAVRLLARHVPLSWPLLPLVYAISTTRGDRWLAGDREQLTSDLERTCEVVPPPKTQRAVACVAVILVGMNSLAGVGAVSAAWPFACYPTFAGMAQTERAELVIVLDRPDGEREQLDTATLRRLVSWEKFDGMARPIVRGDTGADQRAMALVDAVADAGVDVPPGTTVEFYRAVASLDPDADDDGEDLVKLTALVR